MIMCGKLGCMSLAVVAHVYGFYHGEGRCVVVIQVLVKVYEALTLPPPTHTHALDHTTPAWYLTWLGSADA